MNLFLLKFSATSGADEKTKYKVHVGKNMQSILHEENTKAVELFKELGETNKYQSIVLMEEEDEKTGKMQFRAYFFINHSQNSKTKDTVTVPRCFYVIAGIKNSNGNFVLNNLQIKTEFVRKSVMPGYRLEAKGMKNIIQNKGADNIVMFFPPKE